VVVGVGNVADGQVRIGVAAVDLVVLLPEPAAHLQADLARRRVGHVAQRGADFGGEIRVQLVHDGRGQGDDAVVGGHLVQAAQLLVPVYDAHAVGGLANLLHLG